MTAIQQKSHAIDKKNDISLMFKDIFCFQSSSKSYSPILQIFDDPGIISLFQSTIPEFHETSLSGG